MILSEEEAHKKLCQETFNRPTVERYMPCCGSGCMAWRWQYGESDQTDAKGYCGKAGRPSP